VQDGGARAAGTGFAGRLAARVAQRESQIVLGLDPDPARLWPEAARAAAGAAAALVADAGPAGAVPDGPGAGPAERAAAAVTAHCRALIDAAGPACVAIKPQVACFERLGAPGWAALAAVAAHARTAGLLVLADAKRGDIDVTAAAYAQALLTGADTPWGRVAGLGADAITINPYLGRDSLAPFVAAAASAGAGLFVLVRTSNPGAADVEDLELASGGALWERVAAIVDELGRELEAAEAAPPGAAGSPAEAAGPRARLAGVGAVMGATAPEHLARARELMPRAPFLLPGIGAQGGRVEELAPAFAPGPAGGLVTASRSIARAHEAGGSDPASAARAEAERLRAAAWAQHCS
jgi:orotidine-5'-phosphate decarboxylase